MGLISYCRSCHMALKTSLSGPGSGPFNAIYQGPASIEFQACISHCTTCSEFKVCILESPVDMLSIDTDF